MKESGLLLIAIGIGLALYAFTMDTTVSSAGTYIGGELVGGGSTYNLGLLQRQMMVFQSGLGLLIAGAALAAGGVRTGGTSNPPSQPQTPESSASAPLVPERQETAEERRERVAAERRTDIIAYAVVIGLGALAFILWAVERM